MCRKNDATLGVAVPDDGAATTTSKGASRRKDGSSSAVTGGGDPNAPAVKVSFFSLFRYASYTDVFLLSLGTLFCVAMSATLPSINIIFGDLIDAVASPVNVREVMRTALVGMVSVAAYGFTTFFLGYALCGWAAARVANGFRSRFLDAVLRQDAAFFDVHAGPPGALSLALTDSAFEIQNGLADKYAAMLQGGFQFLFGLGVAFYYGPLLTLVLLSCAPALAAVMTLLIMWGAEDGVLGKEAYASAAAIATEALSHVRTVFALNVETEMSRRYDERLLESEKAAVRQAKKVTGLGSLLFSFMFVMYGIGFWYGAILIADSTDEAIGAQPLPEAYSIGASPFTENQLFLTDAWCGAEHDVGSEAYEVCVCGLPWDTLSNYTNPNCGCGYRNDDVSLTEMERLSQKPPCFSGGKTCLVFFAVLIGAFAAGQVGPGVSALQEAKAAAAKMIAVIERVPDIDVNDVEGKVRLKPGSVRGEITFENVTFSYARSAAPGAEEDGAKKKKKKSKKKGNDSQHSSISNTTATDDSSLPERRLVFGGCDLQINAGESVALVGESGCGKSTVARLLQRFYDPDDGRVLLDSTDLKDIAVSDLRAAIGVVSQEPLLFDKSVRENIRCGRPDATDTEVERAARDANAHDFVSAFPDGYDTLVGAGGSRLSGGQKQRVAIARAILRDPAILILDEATSALDTKSERVVQKALDRLLKDDGEGQRKRTTVIIAHRLSTVRNADRIVVLGSPEGTSTAATGSVILEQGSHDELMGRPNGYYKALVGAGGKNNDEGLSPEEEGQINEDFIAEEDDVEVTLRRMSTVELDKDDGGIEVAVSDGRHEEDLEVGRTKNSDDGSGGGFLSKLCGGGGKQNEEAQAEKARAKANKRRVWNYTKPETPLIIVGSIASVLKGTIFPLLSLVFSEMIAIFFLSDTEELRSKALTWSFFFYALSVASFIVEFIQKFLFERVGERITRRLRSDLFRAMLKQDLSWFEEDPEKRNVGALSSTLATDVRFVRLVAGQSLAATLESFASLSTGIAIALVASWEIFLIMLAMVPLLGITEMVQMRALLGSEGDLRSVLTKSTGILHESITGIREVQAFALEQRISKDIKTSLFDDVGPASRRAALIKGLTMGAIQAVMLSVYALAFWFGGEMIAAGRISFEDFNQALWAMAFSASGLGQAAMFAGDAAKAAMAIKVIFGIIDREPEVKSEPWENGGVADPKVVGSPAPRALPPGSFSEGSARLDGVNFAYPTRKAARIFNGMDLSIPSGKVVALVGSSGSGKSSVVQLLERFYDPIRYEEVTKMDRSDKNNDDDNNMDTVVKEMVAVADGNGTVNIDGEDMKTLDCRWVRSNVGLVGQEPVLFNDTVYNNIALGAKDPATVTRREVEEAALAANAHEFILKLPQAYNSPVGVGGGRLSGGQKQRVAIARALVAKPRVLLLDEATSALDNESEKIVQASLDELVQEAGGERTTIIIAHRLSTIKEADVICVLENDGGNGSRVVEIGSHDELMEMGRKYKALVEAYEK